MDNSINPFDDLYKNPVINEYFGLDTITKQRAKLEVSYWAFITEILRDRKITARAPNKTEIQQALNLANNIKYENIGEHLATTRHEIKALEYTLRDAFEHHHLPSSELIHFGLTSQDIVDPVYTITIREFIKSVLVPELKFVRNNIGTFYQNNEKSKFPARTHGQLAVPTTMAKEFDVYFYRLGTSLYELIDDTNKLKVKFGGAIGGFDVHRFIDDSFNWKAEVDRFFKDIYDIGVHVATTQVNGNDDKARVFSDLIIINNILIDMCQDIWLYFSYEYLSIKRDKGHVGSSTMAQKNNPIEFENVEGILQLVNSELHFMMDKLTRSRGQRDLSDSVVQRFYGLMFAKMLHAYNKMGKAIAKLEFIYVNGQKDLNENCQIYAEILQSCARLDGVDRFEEVKEIMANTKLPTSHFMNIVDSKFPKYKEKIEQYMLK